MKVHEAPLQTKYIIRSQKTFCNDCNLHKPDESSKNTFHCLNLNFFLNKLMNRLLRVRKINLITVNVNQYV